MKKTLFFSLIAFLFSATAANAQLNWSAEYSVADGSTYGNFWPRIVLVNGDPVVSFGHGQNEQLYVAKWNGSGFNTPTEISKPGAAAYVQDWAGPGIAAQGNNVFVAFTTTPYYSGEIYLRKSSDGGATFGDTIRVAYLDSGFAQLPSVTVTPAGNPIVMWMAHDDAGFDNKYVTATSTDGGLTFGAPVSATELAPGAEVCDCCPAEISANDNYTVTVFRDNNNNLRDFYASISNDNGATYNQPIDIDTTDWVLNGCPSSGPDALVSGSTLTAVYSSGATSPQRIYVSQVDLLTGLTTINTHNYMTPDPVQASLTKPRVDGVGDTLGFVWEQNRLGQLEVAFTYSTTGVAGIPSAYDTVNVESSGFQKMPDIAYSNRKFHFVWHDSFTGDIRYRYASFDPITAVEEQALALDLKVFPNPTQNSVNVDLTAFGAIEKGVFEIYTTTGALVKTLPATQGNNTIDLSDVAEGLYFLKLNANGSVWSERIIKH